MKSSTNTLPSLWFKVQGSGFKGSGFKGSGFKVQGSRFKGSRFKGSRFKGYNHLTSLTLQFTVHGSRF